MDGLKNYREKLKNIEELVDKMESGELSIHELVDLESLTRELHERSIILKYKAFENKMGVVEEQSSEQEVVEEDLTEPVEEVIELEEPEETPVLDFSMFNEPVEEKEPEVKPEPVIALTSEPIVEEQPAAVVPEPEVTSEPEITPEPTPTPVENTFTPEPEAQTPPAEENKVVVNEKGTSFLDRLTIEDNSISSQLAGRKIETLSGAFGINQRLLYINELFDGSGEDFSDAVKLLDTQSNLDEASSKVEELAFKHSWNPEEDVVLEFLAIIKRRYA